MNHQHYNIKDLENLYTAFFIETGENTVNAFLAWLKKKDTCPICYGSKLIKETFSNEAEISERFTCLDCMKVVLSYNNKRDYSKSGYEYKMQDKALGT